MGMRARARWDGRPLSKQETAAILDFLDYDSRRRKIERARDFDRETEELKRRFDAALAARVRELLRANPRALEPPSPNVFGP